MAVDKREDIGNWWRKH